MKNKSKWITLGAVTALVAAFLTTGAALASSNNTQYTGCLNGAGTISRVTEGNTLLNGECPANHTMITWSQEGPPGLPGADGADGADGAPGLPGADGADGADGAPGLPGADGADGVDGAPGLPGADGADGVDGAAGLPGADGADGVDGVDGAQGPPGADGADGASAVFYERTVSIVGDELRATSVIGTAVCDDPGHTAVGGGYDGEILGRLKGVRGVTVSRPLGSAWEVQASLSLGDTMTVYVICAG